LAAAAGSWTVRAIIVLRVLTDNGAPYRSKLFAQTLGPITHKRTRPYRPQTNGKVERFNRTLGEEWACARLYLSEAEREATYATFTHTHNHHRGHTALGGKSPADPVPSSRGTYT
jgi:transposase InsO family protein